MKFRNLFLIGLLALTLAGIYGLSPQGVPQFFEKKVVMTLRAKTFLGHQGGDMEQPKNLGSKDAVSTDRMACVFTPGMDSCSLDLGER